MPDPLQVAVTELRHVSQSLFLLTAERTERLRVKVLQQGQLQPDKGQSLFTTYVKTKRHTVDKLFKSFSIPERP